MALTRTRSEERASARRRILEARLRRVYRAAELAMSGMESLGHGVYRMNPGDVLHLRLKVRQAKELIDQEGAIECH